MIRHPRYDGAVIDAHCHYDQSTVAVAMSVNVLAGLAYAIHLWDIEWPPSSFPATRAEWDHLAPTLLRAHVPDFSRVGLPKDHVRLEREARQAIASGAVAIKVWKNLGLWLTDSNGERLTLTDPRLEPLWGVAADLDVPVVIHVGDPPAFFAPLDNENPRIDELRVHPEWWYGDGRFPTLEELHEKFETLVAGHPDVRFIGAHFGCFMTWEDVDRMLGSYPNYHVDTAAAIADLGRGDIKRVREVFLKWPTRIVFGTDLIRTRGFDMPAAPWEHRWELEEFFNRHWAFFETGESELEHPLPAQGAWTVTGIDLPAENLEALYMSNAQRVFHLGEVQSQAPARA